MDLFFYPLAINVVQGLAIKKDENDRTISKSNFITAISKKDVVFSHWLRWKFGDKHYETAIKRKYFNWPSTKVPRKSRILIIDLSGESAVNKISALLAEIGRKLSHVEHLRTPAHDRFCPYVHLRGLTRDSLIGVKNCLVRTGIVLRDGHSFDGAAFSPQDLVRPPTKEQLVQLKFIGEAQQLASVASAIIDTQVEVFEFFRETSIANEYVPENFLCHVIKIDSALTIERVI